MMTRMTRTDIHLDAMLRHPGAAYYDSLNQPPAVAGEPALQHTAAQVTGGHGDSPH